MAVPVFTVGEVLTASLVNNWLAPLAAAKTSDESVTSSTTLQNDNELAVAAAANCTYAVTCFVKYDGGTLGSSDLKAAFTVPAGATFLWAVSNKDTSGNPNVGGFLTTGAVAAGTAGLGTFRTLVVTGTLAVSSTAGNLQLQWAQQTSSGTATTVYANSWLLAQRIA